MTEMEEKFFDKLIKDIEKDIDYPTVWDDGKTRHYEDTIHCPNCGKRRKVLTSKTYCEFCDIAFSKFYVKKCPKCKDLNLIDEKVCRHCGHDFYQKECEVNDEIVKDVKRCKYCRKEIGMDDRYCIYCGRKQEEIIKCSNCGKSNISNNKFCSECGGKL